MIVPSNKKLIIVISFEDYNGSLGGTGKVILSQQSVLNDNCFSTLFICPFHLQSNSKHNWLLRLDGKEIMVCNADTITRYISLLQQSDFVVCGVQIHHLRGINIIDLETILNSLSCPILYYVHDFYSICPNCINLMKDDGSLCNVRNISLDKCKKCDYYSKMTIIIMQFFENNKHRIKFICPSDSCKHIWLTRFPEYRNQTFAVYHQKLLGRYDNNGMVPVNEKIKIAYVGAPSRIKGWNDFLDLLKSINKNKFEVYSFGNGKCDDKTVQTVKVDYHQSNDAMVKMLRQYNIQIVLLLSKWPETYSYTFYESLAADSYIITYSSSGNIADQVIDRKCGLIFKNLHELEMYFQDNQTVRDDLINFRVSPHEAPLFLEENNEFIGFFENPICDEQKAVVSKNAHIKRGLVLLSLYKAKNKIKSLLR